MDNAIVATGLSLAVTLLTSLFKTANLSSKQKNLIATVLSVVAGAASVLLSGKDLSTADVASTAVAIYGASQIAYQFILKGTSLNKVLTNAKLFGSSAKAVEDTLAKVSTVEAAVKQTKKTAAKTTTKKTTANSKRVTK